MVYFQTAITLERMDRFGRSSAHNDRKKTGFKMDVALLI